MSEHLPAEVDGERKQLFEKIRHPKKRVFLASFCLSGRVREACKEAEIHFSLHYWWIKHDKAYAAALEAAKQIVADHMEDEVYRRAFQGTNHPVIHKGKITDWYKEYSDLLAMFALKQLRPAYRDSFNVNQFAGPVQL